MIFDPSTSDHLKPWLTKTLEPMSVHLLLSSTFPVTHDEFISSLRCDADPSALADYILALLKHNGPESELRKELAAQLDEFLEKGASPCHSHSPFSTF
jgi:RNA-binding protein 26